MLYPREVWYQRTQDVTRYHAWPVCTDIRLFSHHNSDNGKNNYINTPPSAWNTQPVLWLEWQRVPELEARYLELRPIQRSRTINIDLPFTHLLNMNISVTRRPMTTVMQYNWLLIGTRTHGHGIPLILLQQSQDRFINSTTANAHRLLICSSGSNGDWTTSTSSKKSLA